MTWTIYRFDDAGAPNLVGTSGSLNALLDACLVNGYGSKAAAGWTKDPISVGNVAIYRNASGTNRYLRVDNTIATSNARVRAYKTMSDANTGTIPTPTDAQVSGGLHIIGCQSTTVSCPWLVAADGKRFFLWTAFGSPESNGVALTSSNYGILSFFGDLSEVKAGDETHFAVSSTPSSSFSSNVFGFDSRIDGAAGGNYILGSSEQVDGSLVALQVGNYGITTGYSGLVGAPLSQPYPDKRTGGLTLIPAWNADSLSIRGRVPGMWFIGNRTPTAAGDTFSGRGALAGKTFIILQVYAVSSHLRIALETSNTVI